MRGAYGLPSQPSLRGRAGWGIGALRSTLAALLLGGCQFTVERDVGGVDTPVPAPTAEQLEIWRKNDPWRADPCHVAHEELRTRIDVPFRGERYLPEHYEFHEENPEHPDWGCYVIRGYKDHSGRQIR